MLHGRILTKTVFGSLRSIWAPSSLNLVSSGQRQWFSASPECCISLVHSVTPLEYVALVCLPPSECSWADRPKAKATERLAFGLFCSCLWQRLVAFLIGQFLFFFLTLFLISRYVSLALTSISSSRSRLLLFSLPFFSPVSIIQVTFLSSSLH